MTTLDPTRNGRMADSLAWSPFRMEPRATAAVIGGAIAGQTLDPTPSVRTLDGVAGVVNVADGLLRRAGVN